jgi:putative nucleotidyltransferase with HDIG domain
MRGDLVQPIYEEIWEIASPYQDKRGDKGHAETVLYFATKLLETEDAKEDIVIPAAILHDIGWSQLPQEERLRIFHSDITKEEKIKVQKKHESEGVNLARRILADVVYPDSVAKNILDIIARHDTGTGFLSVEEGIIRDADKLWRFGSRGFAVDLKRYNCSPEVLLEKLRNDLDCPDFLYLLRSKKLAQVEYDARRKEYGIS